MVLVAFAGIAGTPVNSNVGKATKLPPPATALSAPPSTAAKNNKTAFQRLK
jgi:hypothetical protein